MVCLFFAVSLLPQKVSGQTVTQTFIDKCTGETKIATTTIVNGNAIVSFYNQIRTFTPAEVNSGLAQSWLLQVKTSYEAITCPVNNPVVTQTIQQAVSSAATTAASTAASNAASSAASSSASSSAASSASSSSTPSSNTSTSSSGGSNKTSSSSESSSSSEGGSTSSENSSSSEGETSSSESSSSDGESSSESKSDENKKDEKKEEKKKQQNVNPLLLSSDLTSMQSNDGSYAAVVSMGVSQSSMAGDKSYGLNGMVWSTLDQYVLSSNYTKMEFERGKLNSIHSYGASVAYLKGSWMILTTYTLIKPHPKFGTYGLNVGGIGLISENIKGKLDITISTSMVGFWTKPYQVSTKVTLSPQIFIMSTPISYQPSLGTTTVSRDLGFLVGSSFDYKLSKRFGLSLNYKANYSTLPGSPILHNFLVGSRMIL